MEQNLKQRLVGALVLISLAVIFLPLIFDRQQQRIDTSQYQIPEKPAMTIKAPDTGSLEQQVKAGYQPIAKVEQEKQAQDEASVADTSASDATNAKPDAGASSAAATSSAASIPATGTAAKPDTASPAKSPADSLASTTPTQAEVKQYLDKEKKTDAEIHALPPKATVPLAEAWIIQVGAFSGRDNADRLSNTLKAGGHQAFVKPVKAGSRTLYKVYVGPEIRRYRLEKEKSELEHKYKLKAMILKYIP